jgi:uncharacterized repeat protein (TIGR01451 family)
MARIGIVSRAVVLVFVGALLFAGAASAATLTVTTTTDSSTPGSGSLRAQIAAAGPGDTVMVPASTNPYTISLGAIPVANGITIDGAGASQTAIEVSASSPSGAFHVTSGATDTVTFENLTIKGGAVTASPGGGGILVDSSPLDLSGVTMTGNSVTLAANTDSEIGGGAIYSTGGDITITNSTLNGNSVTDAGGGTHDEALGGAAVYEQGDGTISISGSTIDSNTVSIGTSECCDGGAVYENKNLPVTISGSHLDGNGLTVTGSTDCCNGGAAVYNDGSSAASTTISGSTLSNDTVDISDTGPNSCCDGGGALYQDTSTGSSVTITESTLSNDKATATSVDCCSGGGAIFSFRLVTVSDSTLNSNTSDVTDGNCCDGGGAINVDSQAISSATDSELSDNTSTVDWTGVNTSGNPGSYDGGGAILDDDGDGFRLVGSDVSGNTSNLSPNVTESGGGGLLEDSQQPEAITNSTLSGNTTNATGAGNGGGAVYFATPAGDTNLLSFDTIAGNSAPSGGGGGLFAYGTGNSIKGSIVAANTASTGNDCAGTANGANAFTFTSAGYNLEDSPDTCTFTQPTDKVVGASSLGLGPLANNGGATMTRSLLIGSPAINAVPLASCTDQTSPTPVTITTDQRGVARPQPAGGNCDIGAFEFGDSDVSLTGTAVPSPTAVTVGQTATLSLTVANAGPVPATATTVSLALPKGLKLISATPGTGSCAADTCSLGALAVAGHDPITVVIEPTAPGKFTVRATAATTSDDPNAANNSVSFALNGTLKPTLTHVSQSHKTWRKGSKLAHLARKKAKKPPVGTTFSFTLNESAKVTFAFEQGHKTRGTLSYNAKSGKRKVSFDGKLSRSKKLKPGSYTVVITANATGLTSKPAKLSFKLASG